MLLRYKTTLQALKIEVTLYTVTYSNSANACKCILMNTPEIRLTKGGWNKSALAWTSLHFSHFGSVL